MYGIEMNSLENRKNEFIRRAKIVHCGENIDYSLVDYVNNRTPVLLIDHDKRENGAEYGEFWQTPSNHLKGQSHPDKRKGKISKKKSFTTEEIIVKFKKAHPNEKLDYSEVVYKNMHTKVKIIDRDIKEDGTEYGEYWQEPSAHLKGCGHPLKGVKRQIEKQSLNTNEFIEKAELVHSNYDYSKVEYVNNKTKVIIICQKHGEFLISPDNFLQGKGCPKCGNHLSYAEEEICKLISKHYEVERNNRSILNGLEIDIFVPTLKIGIEYNGLRWHSERFGKDRNYHLNKLNLANNNGIKLIQIFEDEYLNNNEIVLNKIKHILNIDKGGKNKIYGRKCIVKVISSVDAKVFLNKNHIQGYKRSKVHFGAFLGDKLIGVMSFTKNKKEWILERFSSDFEYICIGVGGKLFSAFVREYNPEVVISFADRRWTIKEDNLYTKLGFEFNGVVKPDYRYYKNGDGCNRYHKFNFRKHILNKKYGLPLTMTENEMTKELGYDRIWDCGLIRYVWKNPFLTNDCIYINK